MEGIEIGFTEEVRTPNEMRKELKNELRQMDLEENSTDSKVGIEPVVVPEKIVRGIIRAENAVILAVLTKDSDSSVKQAAKEALEPNADDVKVVGDFLQEVIKRYAPTTFKDPLVTAAICYGGNISMKVATVIAIKQGGN